VAIHDIDMEPIRSGLLDLLYLVRETAEVACQEAGSHENLPRTHAVLPTWHIADSCDVSVSATGPTTARWNLGVTKRWRATRWMSLAVTFAMWANNFLGSAMCPVVTACSPTQSM
jgi:hypothetical protein